MLAVGMGLCSGGKVRWTPVHWARNSVAPFWDIKATNYQDVGRVTQTVDVTDPVALMEDASGAEFEASQPVTAQQPELAETIAEDGKLYRHLLFDGIDDSLSAVLPDMGSDAVVWSAGMAGITVEEGRTIGAGPYNLLPDKAIQGVKTGGISLADINKLLRYLKTYSPGKYPYMKSRIDVICMNAVDVKIYDTSRDSDGGAWVAAATTQSWYNEPLNTATRGASRSFPKLVVIVAEVSRVVLYDGDSPELPMWMVIDKMNGVSDMLFRREVSCVDMLNGVLSVGCPQGSLGTGGYKGLALFNFPGDRVEHVNKYGKYTFAEPIAGRNIAVYESGGINDPAFWIAPGLVNEDVNDLALTSLTGAAIDSGSGLPVLTIAVATDAGVSVVTDDGNIWDITAAMWNMISSNIAFDGDQIVWIADSGPDARIVLVQTIPSADVSIPESEWQRGNTDERYIRAVGGSWTGDLILPSEGPLRAMAAQAGIISLAHEAPGGLSLIDRDSATPTAGMVAHISNTHNTGWMVGNCELALCDGLTDRSVTGTTVTDNGVAIIAEIAEGAEQKKITASGGTITAPVTTGGAIYGWEEIAGILHFRPGSGWVGISEDAGILTIASGTTFAMLRYTNGAAPSAAQTARMYADELPLFQAAAACTLAGSDAVVTALAHDPDLDLLHLGQFGSTSIFKRLQRIEENSNAVTTTLDVMSGMVAEK